MEFALAPVSTTLNSRAACKSTSSAPRADFHSVPLLLQLVPLIASSMTPSRDKCIELEDMIGLVASRKGLPVGTSTLSGHEGVKKNDSE